MRLPHPFFRALIVLFCCWQMFAVAVYAMPNPAADRVAVWIRGNVQPAVRPYIWVTGQWQQWNLFSPDPMRRATVYVLHSVAPDGSVTKLTELDRKDLRMWRGGDDMASVRRLEDNGDSALPFWQRFMQTYCNKFDLPPGYRMRMDGRYEILPKTEPGQPRVWWRDWEPEWTYFTGTDINCREAGRAADTILP